jgi:hypothetical protein
MMKLKRTVLVLSALLFISIAAMAQVTVEQEQGFFTTAWSTILETAKANWMGFAAALVVIFGGATVPAFRTVILLALKTCLSTKFLTKLFLKIAEHLVKKTENTLDDDWLAAFKENLKRNKVI